MYNYSLHSSLVNQYGNACYTATIIHSQQAVMSSVLVANALNQLQAVAHVIGTNQLPVPELVSNVCNWFSIVPKMYW